MTFEAWLAAKGIDPAAVTDQFRPLLQAAWKADMAARAEPDPLSPEAVIEAARVENDRVRRITTLTAQALQVPYVGRTKIDQLEALQRCAIEGKWTVERFELELLRAGRADVAFNAAYGAEGVPAAEVMECAVCLAGGLSDVERSYREEVIAAARAKWKYGLGLSELLLTAARANGHRGWDMRDTGAVLRAAFAPSPPQLRASGDIPSTYSIPNVIANIANKFAAKAFLAVDSSWRSIAGTRSVKDFRQITSLSLTGSMIYKVVPPSGEIKYTTMSDIKYNNKADSYGAVMGIDRRDLINDDLGVLTDVSKRLGRGGALKINDLFWSTFLNNSSFFTAGNGSAFTGAATALSLTSLGTADRNFRVQNDPDGLPIGYMPRKLVVPTTLRVTGLNLVNSTFVVATNTAQSNVRTEAGNVLQGAYEVVSSPYMENTSYTGNSNAAWYLLADPADLAVIEVCFLNGVEAPNVETSDADFNQLGIVMRGVHDFGIALQEFRGGVRMAGA